MQRPGILSRPHRVSMERLPLELVAKAFLATASSPGALVITSTGVGPTRPEYIHMIGGKTMVKTMLHFDF
jgi:hypothetical protein